MQQDLLFWYDQNARVLPWRSAPAGARDPYHVWLSEVLLQQTQVARAALYFEHFLQAFPTVQQLADAPLEQVLTLWQGAGYYARARNLHRAAQHMAAQGIPQNAAAWQALSGVGRYTAAAISSLCSNEAVAAVDGNIRRVLARLHNNPSPSEGWLWESAQHLLYAPRAGAWNEALIELGALVCTPKSPKCDTCPLSSHCAAFAANTVASVPAPKPKAKVLEIETTALIWHWEGKCWLVQRQKKGLLGGMFSVPLGVELPEGAVFLGEVQHTMSHRHFRIRVYGFASPRNDLVALDAVPLARLDQKILTLLESYFNVTREFTES
ncbi:MAG: A/G-specific adenine glycosylase [Deinococcales bacterium]